MCKAIDTKIIKAISKKIPNHKNNKRIWIETDKINTTLLSRNFTYHYKIDTELKQLMITTSSEDNRKITRRKNGIPIIDINNKDISDLFDGIEKVIIKIYERQIIVEPQKEELLQKKARGKFCEEQITFFDMFAGSGTLSKALIDAGMIPVGAVEYDDRYLQNYEKNNKKVFTYESDIAEIDYAIIPENISVLVGGIPCENFSVSGITKQCSMGQGTREAGHTGSLGYFFLQAVERIRPAVILIEEVVGFQKSAMVDIIRAVLSMRGYSISEKILIGTEYGSMTKRKRFCMVATISNVPFSFSKHGHKNLRKIEDILEIPVANRVWLSKENSKTMAYSLQKEQNHISKGDGFRIARTSLSDEVVATITKGYYKNRLTDPILVHPDNDNMFSWFTPRELARINGLPDTFALPEGKRVKTKSGEMIGQGVCYEPFHRVGLDIVKHIIDTREEK